MKKDDAVLAITFYLICHFMAWMLRISNGSTFPNGLRFLLEKDLAFFVFIGLFYSRELNMVFKHSLMHRLHTGFLISGIMLIYVLLIMRCVLGIQFRTVFNLKWTYEAVIEWGLAFYLIRWVLPVKGIRKDLLSLLLIYAGGLLYEIPIYYRMNPNVGIWAHMSYPFLIASKWIILGLLIYYFYVNFSWKSAGHVHIWFLAGTLLLIFGVIYGFSGIRIAQWIPRIPTILFLAVTVMMLKRRKA